MACCCCFFFWIAVAEDVFSPFFFLYFPRQGQGVSESAQFFF